MNHIAGALFPAPGVDEPELMMEINTTPLIDVMLVLLIMFIITIPVQLHAVNLQAPVLVAQPPVQLPAIVQITVQADNTVLWNGQALPDDAALLVQLQALSVQTTPPEIHIHAHPRCRYGAVAKVMAAAQRLGLRKLGVVAAI